MRTSTHNNFLSTSLQSLQSTIQSLELVRTDIIHPEKLQPIKDSFSAMISKLVPSMMTVPMTHHRKYLFPTEERFKNVLLCLSAVASACLTETDMQNLGCVEQVEELRADYTSQEIAEAYIGEVARLNDDYFECLRIQVLVDNITTAVTVADLTEYDALSYAILSYMLTLVLAFRLEFNGIDSGVSLPDISTLLTNAKNL